MGTISTTIRDIDEPLYRKFRAKCVEKNIRTGDGINQAIRLWLEKQDESEKPIRAHVKHEKEITALEKATA